MFKKRFLLALLLPSLLRASMTEVNPSIEDLAKTSGLKVWHAEISCETVQRNIDIELIHFTKSTDLKIKPMASLRALAARDFSVINLSVRWATRSGVVNIEANGFQSWEKNVMFECAPCLRVTPPIKMEKVGYVIFAKYREGTTAAEGIVEGYAIRIGGTNGSP